jgi:hypothetical protein
MWNCRPLSLSPARGAASLRIASRLGLLALQAAIALLVGLAVVTTPSSGTPQKKEKKSPSLQWDPPQVDAPVQGISATPPCPLADVLKQAGKRAQELIADLRNFDAHERIRYSQTDGAGVPEVFTDAKFDYLVDFGGKPDAIKVYETRTPLARSDDVRISEIADRGLPVLALIFNPNLQNDYEMRCEGFAPWNNQPAWVVYFRQSTQKRPRTFGVRTDKQVFQVSLKGRAWIATDSGQVIHLETNLVKGIAAIGLQENAVSVDYAPVKFSSRDVEIWLPQSAVAYSDYGRRRMIIGHTFSDFQLFSVQTQQVIEQPKTP